MDIFSKRAIKQFIHPQVVDIESIKSISPVKSMDEVLKIDEVTKMYELTDAQASQLRSMQKRKGRKY